MKSVTYVGTSDVRNLSVKDLNDKAKEDLVFHRGVPVEVNEEVWKVLSEHPGLVGEFTLEDDDGQLPLPEPEVPQLTNPPEQVTPPQGSLDEQIDDDESKSESTDSGKNSGKSKSK